MNGYTYIIHKNVLAKTVFVVLEEKYLTMTMFIGSQGITSVPSFMFVRVAVSDIKQDYFQFNNFPMHIISPLFNQSCTFTIPTH